MSEIENDGIEVEPANEMKMMTLGMAKKMVDNYLRINTMQLPYETSEKYEERIYKTMESILLEAIWRRELEMKLKLKDFDGWKSGLPFESVDGGYDAYSYEESHIERDRFMQFVKEVAPDLIILKGASEENVDTTNNVTTSSYEQIEFPEFKGLAIEELTKEKFEEIKKAYGMLKIEVAKLNKTIFIAAQVGLLFYQHGLKKPVTAPDFIKEYKKHFNGIPKRLVKRIYDVLPDEYISFENDAAKSDDTISEDAIDCIINASIATGLICSKSVMGNSTKLEEELTRFEFEVPPPKYLKAITGASKKVLNKYKDAIA